MNYDRVQLKLEAKRLIKGTSPKAWLVMLVFTLLTTMVPLVVTSLVPNPLMEAMVLVAGEYATAEQVLAYMGASVAGGAAISLFVSIAIALFIIVMSYGYYNYGLKVYRREPASYGDLFRGFSMAGKALGTGIMVAVFSFLWTMLLMVGIIVVLALLGILLRGSVIFMVLAVAAYIVMIILVIKITLRYALAPYILLDRNCGVFEAITESKQLMRGNTGKLFVLYLSFIGWTLLATAIATVVAFIGTAIVIAANVAIGADPVLLIFTAGLPMVLVGIVALVATYPITLWLLAYQSTATAGFYLTLAGQGDNHFQPLDMNNAPTIPPAPPLYTPTPDQTPVVEAPAKEAPIVEVPVVEVPAEEAPAVDAGLPQEVEPDKTAE